MWIQHEEVPDCSLWENRVVDFKNIEYLYYLSLMSKRVACNFKEGNKIE
jgi:hypothetical protein